MIRLKKKQEEKAAAAAAEAAAAEAEAAAEAAEAAAGGEGAADAGAEGKTDDAAAPAQAKGGTVKIFGVGRGKKGGRRAQKKTPGEIRIQKDIAELDGGTVADVEFPDPNNLRRFKVFVTPDSGYWQSARYEFTFDVPALYPHEPPHVHLADHQKIYHPNIDLTGAVCLNILRAEWKPVLDINAVIYGLIFLFYEPNPEDPLNREAAAEFRNDINSFERNVQRSLRGGSVNGTQFERMV